MFKNTFAPACKNRELDVNDIIAGLGFGAFKYRTLPPEVRKAVDEEMKRRAVARGRHPRANEAKQRAEMLDAARDIVQRRAGGSSDDVRTAKGEKEAEAERTRLNISGINAPLANIRKSRP